MYEMIKNAVDTEFLDEPAYRWFFAIFILSAMIAIWRSLLQFMHV